MLNYLPSFVTSIRLALGPLLAYNLFTYQLSQSLILLGIIILSDSADGYLARRFQATTSFGAWLDVTADFSVISLAYSALILRGIMPEWVLGLIIFMFLQFILSSLWSTKESRNPLYDPVGKAYGTTLCCLLILIVCLPDSSLIQLTSFSILILTTVSIISRITSKAKQTTRRLT